MSNDAAALETVDLIYRAALDPELWPEALAKFADAVGCMGMVMIPITPNDATGVVSSPSLGEPDAEYHRHWWRHDTRVGRIFARGLSRGVFCEAELFEEDELARDPFRQEFCRSFGMGAFASQLVETWPGHVVAFSAQRSMRRGHFERSELERLGMLGRHAARALTISQRLAAGDGIAGGLMEIVDKFQGAVFVLNGRGEVTLTNACADRLLGDGLTMSNRHLFASAAERQPALEALISSAIDRKTKDADFGALPLPRPSGGKPLLVQVLPLGSRRSTEKALDRAPEPRGALVLVIDPEAAGAGPHECLRLLGLTAAEARLAALVGTGMRRHDAADLLGVTDWTAHAALKLIYSKLGIASQGELARLVGRVSAAEPGRRNGG